MAILHAGEESVRALIALQALDLALDALAREQASVPVRKAAETAAFEGKRSAVSAARAELVRLQVEKKDRELRAAGKEEEIRKHQRDLNQIKTNDAYRALETEIAAAAREKDSLETEALELMERIDAASADEKRELAALAVLEAALGERLAALDAELAALKSREDALRAERGKYLPAIPEELLARYEFLRGRLKGLAVAEAATQPGGKISCGGCHMKLRPQNSVDLLRPDAFAVCDECQRLLYMKKPSSGETA